MKTFLKIALLLIVVLGVTLYLSSGLIKRFVADRVEALVAGYLNPELVIEDFTYVFPFTVKVSNLKLVQDGVAILEVPEGMIVLERLPLGSSQVRFERFQLQSPILRLEVDESDELVGWGDLLKPSDAPDAADEPIRNSDAFAVREITIADATIEYSDADFPDRAMRLDDIDLNIDARPNDGSVPGADAPPRDLPEDAPAIPRGQNWYCLETTLDRAPLLVIDLDGGLDIDTGNLVFRSLRIDASLDPADAGSLPPQVQTLIDDWSLRGRLETETWGTLVVDDPLKGPLDLSLVLRDASFASPDGYVESRELKSEFSLRSDLLVMPKLDADLLGGELKGDGQILLEAEPARPAGRAVTDRKSEKIEAAVAAGEAVRMIPARPAYSTMLGLQLKGIDLQRFTSSMASDSRLRGVLDLDLEANGVATEFPRTLAGEGRLEVSRGRLANIPLISSLGRVMNAILLRDVDDDCLQTDLELRPDGVVMDDISLIAGLMAARGRGIVRFDETMEFVLNGGPMERIQNSLGALGRALGSLTDRIVRYQVTGELGAPRVRVRPLGISVRDPTRLPDPEPEQAPDSGSDG